MERLEKVKNDIVSLNNRKNEYANKKINGQISDREEKELLSRIIYLISEIRNVAFEMGVKENGQITVSYNNEEERKQLEEKFLILNHLNQQTKDLKSQILLIRDNTPVQLMDIMKKGREELLKNRENPKKDTKKEEIKARLKSKVSSENGNK